MLSKNNKSILFYSLLGDYYLYMYKKNPRGDSINDYTSILLEDIFNETSYIIESSFLYKNTNSMLFLGKIKYVSPTKVSFFDLTGMEIEPTAIYILNKNNNNIINTNYIENIIEYMQINKIKETLIYYTKNQFLTNEESKVMFNTSEVEINKFLAYLIYKTIMFSTYNKNLINNIIAVYFNVPYCLSNDDTIIRYEDNTITTQNNTYEITHNYYIKRENENIKFGEPLYYISKINNSYSKPLQTINEKLTYINSYSDTAYLNRLKNYITEVYLDAYISYEALIDNPLKAGTLASILKNISYIDTNINSLREEHNNADTLNINKNIIKDKTDIETIETYSITTHYYDRQVTAQTSLIEFLSVIEKEKYYTEETNKESGLKIDYSIVDTVNEDGYTHGEKEIVNSVEDSKLSAVWTKFTLKNIVENNIKKIIYQDNLKYPLHDNLKYKLIDKPLISIIEKYERTILYFKIDKGYASTDRIITKLYKQTTLNNKENISRVGSLKKKNLLDNFEINKLKYVNQSHFSNIEEKNFNVKLERSLLKTRDNLKGSVDIKIEEDLKTNEKNFFVKKYNNVFSQRDSLVMNSNTTIDKK